MDTRTQTHRATFDVLILIGRPASGKSEIIDFLRQTPDDVRQRQYHIADLDVIDDFPMLWAWLEEDDILEHRLGQPRLHTDADGYFKHRYLWHLLIERISLAYHKRRRDEPSYHEHTSTLIEFSRGSEHGGYAEAFQHLDDAILRRAGIVYVSVSFEESLHKNRRRFNPDRPDSVLEHGLPDEKMTRLYRDDDWRQFTADDPHFVTVRSIPVPYVVFENEDDVTTHTLDLLARRLETVMDQLWAERSIMQAERPSS
ncbi:MAG TPA: hypothetical protein ENN19_18595 [Chloroflexi bacterium]|nr:hypothetical protein [Chloroflexota bacterium]